MRATRVVGTVLGTASSLGWADVTERMVETHNSIGSAVTGGLAGLSAGATMALTAVTLLVEFHPPCSLQTSSSLGESEHTGSADQELN
jgi:hypothetical protein